MSFLAELRNICFFSWAGQSECESRWKHQDEGERLTGEEWGEEALHGALL